MIINKYQQSVLIFALTLKQSVFDNLDETQAALTIV